MKTLLVAVMMVTAFSSAYANHLPGGDSHSHGEWTPRRIGDDRDERQMRESEQQRQHTERMMIEQERLEIERRRLQLERQRQYQEEQERYSRQTCATVRARGGYCRD